jgi:hypothetical protein
VLHIAKGPLIFHIYKDVLSILREGENKIGHGDGNWILGDIDHDNSLHMLSRQHAKANREYFN